MGVTRSRLALGLSLLVVGGACTHPGRPSANPPTTTRTTATRTTTLTSGRDTPLIRALPDGCDNATPTAAQTVTFVRDGRAWAADPTTGSLACMFMVTDSGLFEWGPQADRVVLGGLSVRGVGSTATRPSIATKPTWFSWSRPKGVALVFTAGAGTALKRADIGSSSVADLTPLAGATYGDIAYHPSGLAIAFVAKQAKKTGIWISGNHGENPKELVTSTDGTEFGPIVFSHDGELLYYGAKKKTGENLVVSFNLQGASGSTVWAFDAPVTTLVEGNNVDDLAITYGGCASRKTVVHVAGPKIDPLLADASVSGASVIGRVPTVGFILAAGACDSARDVYISTPGYRRLLVEHVDRVSTRVAEVLPPPALPKTLPQSGFA